MKILEKLLTKFSIYANYHKFFNNHLKILSESQIELILFLLHQEFNRKIL